MRLLHKGGDSTPREKHYWNRLIADVAQTVINTLITQDLVTGVSPGTKSIMLIKKIALFYNWNGNIAAATPGAIMNVNCNLNTQQGLAAVPTMDDPGTIYWHNRACQMAGDGATAGEAPGVQDIQTGYPAYVEFEDPIPVADSEITFYFNCGGMIGTLDATLHIWYDVETVTLDEALQILESYR